MVRAFNMSSLRNTTLEKKRMKSTDDVDDDDKRSSTGTNEAKCDISETTRSLLRTRAGFLKSLLSSEKLAAIKMKPLLTSESRSSLEKSSKSYCSTNHKIEDERLESARAEMGQVRKENQRLKSMLSQIVKDYQSLQQQFFEVVQQEKVEMEPSQNKLLLPYNQENNEEAEHLSLTLGLSLSRLKTDGERRKILTVQSESAKNGNSDLKRELSPDFCSGKIMSCDHESLKDTNKGEISRIWRPSKLLKTMGSDDEQVLGRSHLKKARVCVRVRCDAPTMEDGCHWRKYGQKIAKGNPCPRAYYRCTVSPSCPVRKQVQRCVEDTSVLITTYEGNHNHPLPISATAMAAATSAATSIIQSRSSTSQQPPHHHHGLRSSLSAGLASATSTSGFYGLDFTGNRNPKLPQLYFSNSSLISTCNSHPTVTLDLSSKPDFSNRNGHRSSACFPSLPELPATFLSFSSSPSSSSLSSHLDTRTQKSSSGIASGVLNRGMPFQHQFYQPHLWPVANSQASDPQSLPGKLGTEVTNSISSNSSFESALAAARTSFVGDRATSFLSDKRKEGGFGLNLKLGDEQATPIKSLQPSTRADGIPCASSNHTDKPMALSSQQAPKGSTWFPHSSVALSTSTKSARASIPPAETKDHLIKFLANSEM